MNDDNATKKKEEQFPPRPDDAEQGVEKLLEQYVLDGVTEQATLLTAALRDRKMPSGRALQLLMTVTQAAQSTLAQLGTDDSLDPDMMKQAAGGGYGMQAIGGPRLGAFRGHGAFPGDPMHQVMSTLREQGVAQQIRALATARQEATAMGDNEMAQRLYRRMQALVAPEAPGREGDDPPTIEMAEVPNVPLGTAELLRAGGGVRSSPLSSTSTSTRTPDANSAPGTAFRRTLGVLSPTTKAGSTT